MRNDARSIGRRHDRRGFTLIEILVAMAIVAVLAAIAIPRMSQARERAFRAAVTQDTRGLIQAQERYHLNARVYAANLADLTHQASTGVVAVVSEADADGWSAVVTHAALPAGQGCAVYFGGATPPALPDGSPLTAGSGAVQCVW